MRRLGTFLALVVVLFAGLAAHEIMAQTTGAPKLGTRLITLGP
jgi:hypothetical protein